MMDADEIQLDFDSLKNKEKLADQVQAQEVLLKLQDTIQEAETVFSRLTVPFPDADER
jgi:hypothetical protein